MKINMVKAHSGDKAVASELSFFYHLYLQNHYKLWFNIVIQGAVGSTSAGLKGKQILGILGVLWSFNTVHQNYHFSHSCSK